MASAFSCGRLDAMADLAVAPGVKPAQEIEPAMTTTFAGVRWGTVAPRAPRSWTVTRPHQQPWFWRELAIAAEGNAGPLYLYDRACARQNMVPARLATGGGAKVPCAG